MGRAGVRLKVVFVVALFVAIAAFFFVQPAVEQTLAGDGEIEGYGVSSRGLYAETHGSVSRLGDTTGKLMSYNGKPNSFSIVCDRNRNGANAQHLIFKRDSGFGAPYELANITYDTNGARRGCGKERLDNPKAAHTAKEVRFGNQSEH